MDVQFNPENCGASLPPADSNNNCDPWFWQTPSAALVAAVEYIYLHDPDPTHHNLAFVLRWLMESDEVPGSNTVTNDAVEVPELLTPSDDVPGGY
jgi:hypothetical protein